jgi:hypothetical protein
MCTYNTSEVFLESDEINNSEKDFIRDSLYRQELLNILGIDEFNEDQMNNAIHELYERIKSCIKLKECMTKLAGHFMSEDLELGLMILYAYDYMYLTHTCVSEYLESGEISETNIRKLKSIVF